MRLSSTVLVLVLLIPLAGCSSIFGPTAGDTSSFAPGVSAERVTDASTLDASNRALLGNSSFTYTSNYSQRLSADGYDYAVDHDTRVWVAADGSFLYHHHGVVDGSGNASEHVDGIWTNESIAVTRTVNVANNSVTYTRYRPPEPYTAANVTQSGISNALESATVTETWNESGTTFVRVNASEPESRQWQRAEGDTVNLTTKRNATATIREDGFVPALESSLSGERPLPEAASDSASGDGRPIAQIHDRRRIRYSSVGTTDVPRPDWVDAALAATDGLSYGETTSPRDVKKST